MLEQVSNFFYDAEHFWIVPLVLAILLEAFRFVRAKLAGRFSSFHVPRRVALDQATEPPPQL